MYKHFLTTNPTCKPVSSPLPVHKHFLLSHPLRMPITIPAYGLAVKVTLPDAVLNVVLGYVIVPPPLPGIQVVSNSEPRIVPTHRL